MPYTCWNPSDFSPAGILSIDNLTLTVSSALSTGGARSSFNAITGKWYYEVIATGTYMLGWANASAALNYNNTNAIIVNASGQVSSNGGGTVATIGTPAASNQLFCCAIDIGANLVWFRLGTTGQWNGSATADPGAGIGGITPNSITRPLYAFGAPYGSGSVTTTIAANFGGGGWFAAAGMAGAVPSGFSVWGANQPFTWNPRDKDAGITLSNNNMTCTQQGNTNGAVAQVRAISSLPINPGGKFYWEVTATATQGGMTNQMGVALGTINLSGSRGNLYNQSGTIAIAGSAYIFVDGTSTGYQLPKGRIDQGDIIQFAVDTTNQYSPKIWIGQNGMGFMSGDPNTGSGGVQPNTAGVYFPADMPGYINMADTLNAGPTMAYQPPTGFTPIGVVPSLAGAQQRALILA